jgi:hypothetical protein
LSCRRKFQHKHPGQWSVLKVLPNAYELEEFKALSIRVQLGFFGRETVGKDLALSILNALIDANTLSHITS